MTIKEIDDYFTKVGINTYKKDERRSITNSTARSIIAFIKSEPYKTETIKYMVANRPDVAKTLYKDNYITIDYILKIEEETPEVYYMLPLSIYDKYPELLERLCKNQNVMYDLLPRELQKNEKVQESLSRRVKIYSEKLVDKDGYNELWQDENGNLRSYFTLANNFPIESKEDYLKIVDVYLDSNLSVPMFCKIYKISDVEGFNKLLNRVSKENTKKESEISEVKKTSQNKYLSQIKDIATKIDNDELSFEEYLEKEYNPFHKFSLFMDNVSDKTKLVKQVIAYIDKNIEILKLDRLMTLFEANFDSLPKNIRIYATLVGLNYKNDYAIIFDITKRYKSSYERKSFAGTEIGSSQGMFKITDEVLDEAYAYLEDNDIYICYYTMFETCRKILYGKLNYSKETYDKKNTLKSEIIELALSKAKNIEDYINVMEETASKKM